MSSLWGSGIKLIKPHDVQRDDVIIETIGPDGAGVKFGDSGLEVHTVYAPSASSDLWTIMLRGGAQIRMQPNGRVRVAR